MTGTASIIAAVVSALTALRYTPTGGSEEALFGSVERYSLKDMDSAFRALLVAKQRAAVVVWTGTTAEYIPSGTIMRTRRTTQLSVLVTDRVMGDRDAAAFGSTTTPGVLGLIDRVWETLHGRLIANPDGVDVRPTSADDYTLEMPNLPGRHVGEVIIDAVSGLVSGAATLGPVA